jgi:Family of unknown function (DUF6535)
MEPVIIPIGSNWGGQGMLTVPQTYHYPKRHPDGEIQEFADSSGPIFSMYSHMVEGEDSKMAKRWQKDADGVLIFVGISALSFRGSSPIEILQTGLFSATVSVLLAVTVLDFKPNPQDTSAFYLKNIYQLQVLANPTILPPFNSSTPADPPSSSPPKYVIWVNCLWFSSLIISLTCAMLATLLQQWARRYFRKSRSSKNSPQERARGRALLADGVDKYHLSMMADALLSLIQLSLFLFFIGLLVYLFNVNQIAFIPAVCLVLVSASGYLLITVMPLLQCETPYYTPLSSVIGLWWDMEEMVKKTAQARSKGLDDGILKWIFDSIVNDHELAQFFENIPGFCKSSVVEDPLLRVASLGREKLNIALKKFLERASTSTFLSVSDKTRRLGVCVKVADTARLQHATLSILQELFPWNRLKELQPIEVVQSLGSLDTTMGNEVGLCAQSIIAGMISVNPHDILHGDWLQPFAAEHFGVSEGDIGRYVLPDSNNMALLNLTHITRQILHFALGDDPSRDMADASSYLLPSLSNFNIRHSFPELQRDFRALWTEIDREAPGNRVVGKIRHCLLHLYEELNRDAATAPTDPGGHPPHSAFPSEADDESAHTPPITPSPALPHVAAAPSLLPASGDTTPDSADQSTPAILPYVTQHTGQVTVPLHSSPDPLGSHDLSVVSQALGPNDQRQMGLSSETPQSGTSDSPD